MIRTALAVVAGFVVWFLVATAVNLGLRLSWPEYAQVEKAMQFTLAMKWARLAMGAISSLAAGYAASRAGRHGRAAVVATGLLLLALFVPIHYGLWDRFPVWYHLTFLLSLFPLTVLGGRLDARPVAAQGRYTGGAPA